jgi:hypothetical protein
VEVGVGRGKGAEAVAGEGLWRLAVGVVVLGVCRGALASQSPPPLPPPRLEHARPTPRPPPTSPPQTQRRLSVSNEAQISPIQGARNSDMALSAEFAVSCVLDCSCPLSSAEGGDFLEASGCQWA